uniref:Uncharacterized protein n=1 Tax=Plectus sambesii TaxID=2011161 RepID=A0A914XDI2_9BILA
YPFHITVIMRKVIAILTIFCAISVSEATVSSCYLNADSTGGIPFMQCQSNSQSCFTFTCSANSQTVKGCNGGTNYPEHQCPYLKQQCSSQNGVGTCQECFSDLCNGDGSNGAGVEAPRISLISSFIAVPAFTALIAKLS